MNRIPQRLVVISPRTILMAVAIAIVAFLLLAFIFYARRVLIWIAIAFFLSLALNHIVAPLTRWLPRGPAAIGTFLLVLGAVAGLGFVLVPPLADQIQELVEELPAIVQSLSDGRGPFGEIERKFDLAGKLNEFIDREGAGGLAGLGQPAISVVQEVVTTVFAIVAIGFLTLFMLLEGPRLTGRVEDAVPEQHVDRWLRVRDGVYKAIGGWIIGAIALSIIAGVSAGIVLLIIGAPFAVALALIVAILDPIPFVGATAAAAIVTLVLLATEGFVPALIFLGFVVVYQNVVENHILMPMVYGRTVHLSALAVLVAILIGGELAGIVGAILAIPIAGSLKVLGAEALDWHRNHGRGEPSAPTNDRHGSNEVPRRRKIPTGLRA